jgi:hypothetical protein
MTKSRGSDRGGVRIANSKVNTGGGDIVGRDKVEYSSICTSQIDHIFQPIGQAIEAEGGAGQAAAEEKLRALKDQAAKGDKADDTIVARLLEGIVDLAPGAVSAIIGAFASPILGAISGPITNYVLNKLRGN